MSSIHLNVINNGKASIRIKGDSRERKPKNKLLAWIKKAIRFILQ